jgi:C4-dicarboxylate-specific signal transduction histidine kinase
MVASLVASALRNLEARQELTQARERMLEDAKMRAMGEMAAGIAHDFNNILMALMCNVELLGVATDLRQVHDRLPRLERAILDARTIVQRINKFGAQSGEEFMQVRLSDVLADTIELMQPQFTTHHARRGGDRAHRARHGKGHQRRFPACGSSCDLHNRWCGS